MSEAIPCNEGFDPDTTENEMNEKLEPSEFDVAGEMVALAIKAGRRASYDLLHACDNIPNKEVAEMFIERARHWLSIFALDNGLKDYRYGLHNEIRRLENVADKLRGALVAHGIEADDDGIPF